MACRKNILSPFSVFESWYIKEHVEVKKLPTEWLPDTFAASTFYNGLSAILAGIVANTVTEGLSYGPTAPFLVSAACFAGCLIVVTFTWGENFGDQKVDLIGAYKVI